LTFDRDDGFELWLNGQPAGSGVLTNSAGQASSPSYLTITGLQGRTEVFAVNATNAGPPPNPAAFIASILVAYDDGSYSITSTDSSWLGLPGTSPPTGFQNPAFDDSTWPGVVAVGPFNTAPWSTAGFNAVPIA
jgi:alpha-L-rhamnosidase